VLYYTHNNHYRKSQFVVELTDVAEADAIFDLLENLAGPLCEYMQQDCVGGHDILIMDVLDRKTARKVKNILHEGLTEGSYVVE